MAQPGPGQAKDPRPCPRCGGRMCFSGHTEPRKDGRPRQRWLCLSCRSRTTLSEEAPENRLVSGYDQHVARANVERLRQFCQDNPKRRTFVVTTAINNSEKHYAGWAAMQQVVAHRGAFLAVIPCSYKNVSAYTASEKLDKWYAKHLEKHIIDDDVLLGGGVALMGSVRVQATAVNPLEGMEAVGGVRSTIFGHPQVAYKTVGSPQGKPPKRMWTTGAITQKNYSRTKAGAKGAFHHSISALIVEVENGRAFVRQLHADHAGVICDLERVYTANGVKHHDGIAALVTGDEHWQFMRPGVKRATYTDEGSMVATLRPEYLVRHDTYDHRAASHHDEGKFATQYAKHVNGELDVRKELDGCIQHIDSTTPEGVTNVFPGANHPDHLDYWLDRTSSNKDSPNARIINDLKRLIMDAVDDGDKEPTAWRLYTEPRLKSQAVFLGRNDHFLVGGDIDVSQHGDVGVNGSRGSAKVIAKTLHKAVIGHSHSPCIEKGVYQAGTSTGPLAYSRGLSSWANVHVAVYPNGKRTVIEIFGQQWRMSKSPACPELLDAA